MLQRKTAELAKKLLQQKWSIKQAKNGQVSRKFDLAKIGQVSRKFAAANLFVADSFRFSLIMRSIENDDDYRKEIFLSHLCSRVMDPNFLPVEKMCRRFLFVSILL